MGTCSFSRGAYQDPLLLSWLLDRICLSCYTEKRSNHWTFFFPFPFLNCLPWRKKNLNRLINSSLRRQNLFPKRIFGNGINQSVLWLVLIEFKVLNVNKVELCVTKNRHYRTRYQVNAECHLTIPRCRCVCDAVSVLVKIWSMTDRQTNSLARSTTNTCLIYSLLCWLHALPSVDSLEVRRSLEIATVLNKHDLEKAVALFFFLFYLILSLVIVVNCF